MKQRCKNGPSHLFDFTRKHLIINIYNLVTFIR